MSTTEYVGHWTDLALLVCEFNTSLKKDLGLFELPDPGELLDWFHAATAREPGSIADRIAKMKADGVAGIDEYCRGIIERWEFIADLALEAERERVRTGSAPHAFKSAPSGEWPRYITDVMMRKFIDPATLHQSYTGSTT